MNLPFYIAKRYLLGKKSQNAINIISGISVLGITTGTMALVIVLSVFNGFDSVVKSLYNTFDPDIQISSMEGKTFTPDPAISHSPFFLFREYPPCRRCWKRMCYCSITTGSILLPSKVLMKLFRDVSGLDSMIFDGEMKLKDRNRSYVSGGQWCGLQPGN